MFIRTERLFLRPCWPEDWQELFALLDEGVIRNLARAPWPYTEEDARAFIALARQSRLPHFAVTLPTAQGPRLVGTCGLDEHEGEVELGYWIGPEWQGRGYASEAASAVLRLAAALGHRRLIASHFVDNPASGRVLRKIGFQPTGREPPRFSRGRGEEAQATEYAVELSGEGENGADPDMRRNVA